MAMSSRSLITAVFMAPDMSTNDYPIEESERRYRYL
jgi:hypothetical protein